MLHWCQERFTEMIVDSPNRENQYKEFWKDYARLTGNQNPQELSKLSPIEQMIDKSTGFYKRRRKTQAVFSPCDVRPKIF